MDFLSVFAKLPLHAGVSSSLFLLLVLDDTV